MKPLNRRFLIVLSIYAAYPFVHAPLSWVFGAIFTQSPKLGLHIYGDAKFMIGLALYQLPFSLLFGVLIAIRYRISRDHLVGAFGVGVGFSVASGIGASVLELYQLLGPSFVRFVTFTQYSVQVTAVYIFHYFIYGLALLLGGVLSVIAVKLAVREGESEL